MIIIALRHHHQQHQHLLEKEKDREKKKEEKNHTRGKNSIIKMKNILNVIIIEVVVVKNINVRKLYKILFCRYGQCFVLHAYFPCAIQNR